MPNIVALMYHHVSDAPGAFTVSPEHFRDQMRWLAGSGYRLLSGTEFGSIRAGEMTLDQAGVLITFDDGWLDNWFYALPILEEYRIPSVWFVVTGWAGRGDSRKGKPDPQLKEMDHGRAMELTRDESLRDSVVMRWSELHAARDTGLVDLESHSHSHGAWWEAGNWMEIQESLKKDLCQSVESMVREANCKPTQLCWPKGRFTRSLVQIAAREGFCIQHSVIRGSNTPGDNVPVRRINVENEGASWLRHRLYFYNQPLVGQCAGALHGMVQGYRLKRAYGRMIPSEEWRSLGTYRVLANS